jgi:hypothetical protein
MFKKILKAAVAAAALATGVSFLTREIGKQLLFETFKKNFIGNFILLGLSYVTAKGAENTPIKNIGFKNATRNPVAARNIVYGQTRVGGTIVYQQTSGTDNNRLHNVIALAGHEIEDITWW